MKKKILIGVIIIIVILIIVFGALYIVDHKRMEENEPVIFSTWGKKYSPKIGEENDKSEEQKEKQESNNINFALTMDDEITTDTAWCGTFQLIWNDLKNDLAKQDIVLQEDPENQIVKNLNKEDFKAEYLSESSYYKVYGHPTLELKNQIEEAIKEKFNEKSDILNDFEWREDGVEGDYFLYSMLKKEFEFPVKFDKLQEGTFAEKYNDEDYVGLEKEADEQIRSQVEILYYNSNEDFAVKLKTKQNDEVILAKGTEGATFNEIYNNINENSSNYEGIKEFTEEDELKIPNIDFDEKKEITYLRDKTFQFSNGTEYRIEKAMQTIEFELDEKGGKIKSEAGMMNREMALLPAEQERKFYFDDEFTIFLKETDKEKPYFAAKIQDITKFQ